MYMFSNVKIRFDPEKIVQLKTQSTLKNNINALTLWVYEKGYRNEISVLGDVIVVFSILILYCLLFTPPSQCRRRFTITYKLY